jgi:hypothetical protein
MTVTATILRHIWYKMVQRLSIQRCEDSLGNNKVSRGLELCQYVPKSKRISWQRVLLCAHLGKCCRWPFFLGWAKRVADLSIYLSVYVAVDVITYLRFIYLSDYFYRICFQELKNPSWKRKSDRKRFHV